MRHAGSAGKGDIFVSVGFPEHTYISCDHIEREMRLGKVNKAKQILIYGGSKMGKSNLWRKHFSEDDIIKIPVNSNKTVDDIYSEVLSERNLLMQFFSLGHPNGGSRVAGLVNVI